MTTSHTATIYRGDASQAITGPQELLLLNGGLIGRIGDNECGTMYAIQNPMGWIDIDAALSNVGVQ